MARASTKAIVPGRDISGKESRDGNPPEDLAVDVELDLVGGFENNAAAVAHGINPARWLGVDFEGFPPPG